MAAGLRVVDLRAHQSVTIELASRRRRPREFDFCTDGDVKISQLGGAPREPGGELRELRLLAGVEGARVADEAQRGII